jgi:branched-chain amino acid transport system permease protein
MSGALLTLFALAIVVGLIIWRSQRDVFSLPAGYGDDVRQFRANGRKWALLAGSMMLISVPIGWSWLGYKSFHLPRTFFPGMPFTDKWLLTACTAGVWAIAAMGLNLLIGNTGQISLGHSAFLAVGAFSLGYFGTNLESGKEAGLLNIGLSGNGLHGIIVLILAAVCGGLVAAAIGPFALRLRGNYLAIVSLVLVLGAQHLINTWVGLTGGEGNPRELPTFNFGFTASKPITLRAEEDGATNLLDSWFGATQAGSATDKPGYFWTIWIVVAIMAMLARNLLRSRQGRAMMAVRDRDLSAEVIGVRQMYTKTWAFAVSGGFASLAGALYASLYGHVNKDSFALTVAIGFVTMIVIGGVGTVAGSIVGAMVYVFVPDILDYFEPTLTKALPFIQSDPAKRGLTIDRFTNILFGLLVIIFLIFFPEGLVGIWRKVKRYAITWPLS